MADVSEADGHATTAYPAITSNRPSSRSQAFRACDVHAAPRLPHALAEDWNPILKTAEDLKFGRFKGHEQPGKGKFVMKKPDSPQGEERPKRPRVPPAPRPKPRPPELGQGEDLSEAEGVEGNDSPQVSPRTVKNQEAQAQAKKRVQARSRQEANEPEAGKQGSRSARPKPEKQLCEWCGQLELPDHPKHCNLRPVECKHCGQKLAFAALRQHLKVCNERPITKNELFRGRTGSRTFGSFSRTTTPDFAFDATRLLKTLHTMCDDFQERLEATTKKVMTDDESQADIQELETSFSDMAIQLARLELISTSSEPSTPQQPIVPDELQPASPEDIEDSMDAIVDLQRRFSLFQIMLRAVAESVEEPKRPSTLGSVPPPSGGKRPPSVGRVSTAETPRNNRPGLQLSPLHCSTRTPSRVESRASSRAESFRPRGRSNSRLRSRSKDSTDSRAPSQNRSASRRRSKEAPEQPKLAGPGPAAVGYRDMTVEDMKKEIEQERQRYIAQGLQVLAKQQRDYNEPERQGTGRGSMSVASRRSSTTPTGRRASSAHPETGPLMPTAAEVKQRLQHP